MIHATFASWTPAHVNGIIPDDAQRVEPSTEVQVTFDGRVLVVVETLMSSIGARSYCWRYDLEGMKKSTSGRLGDPMDSELTEAEATWLRFHRLPLAVALAEAA